MGRRWVFQALFRRETDLGSLLVPAQVGLRGRLGGSVRYSLYLRTYCTYSTLGCSATGALGETVAP